MAEKVGSGSGSVGVGGGSDLWGWVQVIVPIVVAVVVFGIVVRLKAELNKGSNAANIPTPFPRFGDANELIAYKLTPKNAGGKPFGPAGDESIAMLQDFAPFESCDRIVPDTALVALLDPESGNQVYGLHEVEKAVVLVKRSDSITVNKVFYYQQQRDSGVLAHVLSLPAFSKAVAHRAKVVEEKTGHSMADILERTLFVQSTGRCGSTLLDKALGSAVGVVSASEPDIYSAAYLAYTDGRITRDELKDIVRQATYVIVSELSTSGLVKVAVKLRSWVGLVSDVFHEAVPEAKMIFLYREPVQTVDSFCMAFLSSWIARAAHSLHIDSMYINNSWMKRFTAQVAPIILDDSRDFSKPLNQLGMIGFVTLQWMAIMEKASLFAEQGLFDAVLRYEELVAFKEDTIVLLIQTLYPDMEVPVTDDLKAVFTRDAHGDNAKTSSSRFASDVKGTLYIQKEDMGPLQEMLQMANYDASILDSRALLLTKQD